MQALIYIMPIFGGIILYLIIHTAVRAPGRALQNKFARLGDLRGKPYSEIAAACGQANSVSVNGDGVKVRQWISTGYHVVLLFDENDNCLGISSSTHV